MVATAAQYEIGPESAEEREMSRLQDDMMMWRRRMAFAACPVCFHCGYIIATLTECRIVLNWSGASGEPKLFHATPCYETALELLKIRASRPASKYEIALALSSFPESSAPLIRNL